MEVFKIYCGDEIINIKELVEADVKRFIKLEYYETKKIIGNEFTKYGIEIIKKEYKNKKFIKEVADFENITECEEEINEIISIIKRNKVTPMTLENVIDDIIETK